MSLAEQYQAAYSLSPSAARVALFMIARLPDMPYPWQLALRTALTHRARHAARLSLIDLLLLADLRLPWHIAHRFMDRAAHEQAGTFVRSVREDVANTSELGPLVSIQRSR